MDPDPRVSGCGLKMLCSNGIDAYLIANRAIISSCATANASFIFRVQNRRPYSIVFCSFESNNNVQPLSYVSGRDFIEYYQNAILAAPEIDTLILRLYQFVILHNKEIIPTYCDIVIIVDSNDDVQFEEVLNFEIAITFIT